MKIFWFSENSKESVIVHLYKDETEDSDLLKRIGPNTFDFVLS